jgi:predicted transcriptional regulator
MSVLGMKTDTYDLILKTLQNPTKLSIVFLLMRFQRMTVTQMSKYVGVGKADLYHFVQQMVKEGLLTKPEAQVKRNYVEKYYRLEWKVLASIDPLEQKKRVRAASQQELKSILQSFLASLGLHFRLFAEEIAKSDDKVLGEISRSFSKERIILSYMVLPDETYESAMKDLNEVLKKITKTWHNRKFAFRGNRIIIVGLPQLAE